MIDLSPYIRTLNDQPVAVFGLGRSGLATVKALAHAGATVIAWDDNAEACDTAKQFGATVQPLDQNTLKTCAFLVLAPGVPLTINPHPVVQAAHAAGIEIISDIELLHRTGHGRRVVGITGTNGKSTTTAIIHHILKQSGLDVACGGNIGVPALALNMPGQDGVFVLELSSYQLDLCSTFRPDIAVLLNITPDHLDRHGTMVEYVHSKARILDGASLAIVGAQAFEFDVVKAQMPDGSFEARPHNDVKYDNLFYTIKKKEREAERGKAKKHPLVSTAGRTIYSDDNSVADLTGILTMPGAHNMQNAAAAWAVCVALGLSSDHMTQGLNTYPGLAHRQYLVRQIDDVLYVNDSKATNAEAAGKALGSYDNIYWIAGGRAKDGGLNGLENYVSRVKRAYLIGEAEDDFAVWFTANNVPYALSGNLNAAVQQAHYDAIQAGSGVVLLSPACASFDQFSSFEERGDVFVDLVGRLS